MVSLQLFLFLIAIRNVNLQWLFSSVCLDHLPGYLTQVDRPGAKSPNPSMVPIARATREKETGSEQTVLRAALSNLLRDHRLARSFFRFTYPHDIFSSPWMPYPRHDFLDNLLSSS